jgi:tetratricopeptide (TPR) repeat protein
MRTTILLSSVLLLWTSSAFGQRVGDRIVVTADESQLTSDNEIVGTVPKGDILTVKEENGESFWVICSTGRATTKGWVKRRDVVSLQKALELFDDEVRRTQTAELYTIRGRISTAIGEYNKALADFNEAIRLDPKSSTAFRQRANAWRKKGQFNKALADFDESIRLDPKCSTTFHLRGNGWLENGDFNRALADYNEAVQRDPQDAMALGSRGLAWDRRQQFDEAIADFTESIRLDPRFADTFAARGLAWFKKGNDQKCIADFNEAILLNPKNAKFYYRRARAWHEMDEFDNAIADFDEAIRLDLKGAEVYARRGVSWYHKGEYGKAIGDLSEAILLDPNDGYSCCALAWIHAICRNERFRDGTRAVKLATKACELSGWKSAYFVCTLAAAYAEVGDFENAVKWQEKCRELSTESEQKKWGFFLELYKSGKPYRDETQTFRLGDYRWNSASRPRLMLAAGK